MIATSDQVVLTDTYSDQELNDAAKAMLEEVSDSPLLRMATVETAVMLLAAFAVESPDPRKAVDQMMGEFRADVENLIRITLNLRAPAPSN